MLALKQLNLAPRLRRLPRLVVDLVLPPTCPGCGRAVADGTALCARCWSAVRFIEPPLCAIYGTPFTQDLGEGIVSAEAMADPPPFRRARSAVVYGDVARRLVHQLKYHDRPHVAEAMATAMHRAGASLFLDGTLIVPVRCIAGGFGSDNSIRRRCLRPESPGEPPSRTTRWRCSGSGRRAARSD
jgi:hypothetical protein